MTLKSSSRCHTDLMAGLRIGEAATRAGTSTATIRYYERAGLMPRPPRSTGGYRLYSDRAVEELRFIRRAQALGFSLDEIRGLLQLSRGGVAPCSRVISLATTHLALLDERIQRLHAFRQQLAAALDKWRSDKCGFTSKGLCDLLGDGEAAADSLRLAMLRQPLHRRRRRASAIPLSLADR